MFLRCSPGARRAAALAAGRTGHSVLPGPAPASARSLGPVPAPARSLGPAPAPALLGLVPSSCFSIRSRPSSWRRMAYTQLSLHSSAVRSNRAFGFWDLRGTRLDVPVLLKGAGTYRELILPCFRRNCSEANKILSFSASNNEL